MTPSTRSAGFVSARTSIVITPKAARCGSPVLRLRADDIQARVASMHELGFGEEDYSWLPQEVASERLRCTSNFGAEYTAHCAAIPSRPARSWPCRSRAQTWGGGLRRGSRNRRCRARHRDRAGPSARGQRDKGNGGLHGEPGESVASGDAALFDDDRDRAVAGNALAGDWARAAGNVRATVGGS